MECTCYRPRYREKDDPVPPAPPCHCQARGRCADRPLYEWVGSGPQWTLRNNKTLVEPSFILLVDGRYHAHARIGGMFQFIKDFDTLQEAHKIAEESAGVNME